MKLILKGNSTQGLLGRIMEAVFIAMARCLVHAYRLGCLSNEQGLKLLHGKESLLEGSNFPPQRKY